MSRLVSRKILIWLFGAAVACTPGVARATTISSPTAVVADTMGTAGGSTTHMIDETGLSAGFVSGVTDFATYIAGSPTHQVNDATNAWAGLSGPTLGHLDFDLGGSFQLSDFVLWTQTNANAVANFSLFVAPDASFSSGVVNLGSFNAVVGLQAQVFAVSGFGEFVRLQVNSNHGGPNVNIGEVAFGTDPAGAAVPEPASMLLLGTGLVGVGARRWRNRRQSK